MIKATVHHYLQLEMTRKKLCLKLFLGIIFSTSIWNDTGMFTTKLLKQMHYHGIHKGSNRATIFCQFFIFIAKLTRL